MPTIRAERALHWQATTMPHCKQGEHRRPTHPLHTTAWCGPRARQVLGKTQRRLGVWGVARVGWQRPQSSLQHHRRQHATSGLPAQRTLQPHPPHTTAWCWIWGRQGLGNHRSTPGLGQQHPILQPQCPDCQPHQHPSCCLPMPQACTKSRTTTTEK